MKRDKKYENINPAQNTFWTNLKKVLLEDSMLRLLLAISIIFAIMFSFGYAEIYEVIVTFVATAIITFISLKNKKICAKDNN